VVAWIIATIKAVVKAAAGERERERKGKRSDGTDRAERIEYPPFPIVPRHSRFDSGD